MFYHLKKLFIIILFERHGGRETEKHLPFAHSFPKRLQQPGLGHNEANSQEPHLGVLRVAGTRAFELSFAVLQDTHKQEAELEEEELGLEPGTLIWDVGIPSGDLNTAQNTHLSLY